MVRRKPHIDLMILVAKNWLILTKQRLCIFGMKGGELFRSFGVCLVERDLDRLVCACRPCQRLSTWCPTEDYRSLTRFIHCESSCKIDLLTGYQVWTAGSALMCAFLSLELRDGSCLVYANIKVVTHGPYRFMFKLLSSAPHEKISVLLEYLETRPLDTARSPA